MKWEGMKHETTEPPSKQVYSGGLLNRIVFSEVGSRGKRVYEKASLNASDGVFCTQWFRLRRCFACDADNRA